MDYPRTRNVSKTRRSLSSSSSFSSFSSCSSSSVVFSGDSPLNSPKTPLHLLGVPFSWEKQPGKPKENSHRLNNHQNNESSNRLPLPPHLNTHFSTTGKTSKSKKNTLPVIVKDPFAAALLQCSKEEGNSEEEEDDDDKGVGRSNKTFSKSNLGNRLSLVNLYGSCRRTCSVSESIVVYLPRPEKRRSSASSTSSPLNPRLW